MVVGSELAAAVCCAVVFRNNKRTKDAMECATKATICAEKGSNEPRTRDIKRSDSRARAHTQCRYIKFYITGMRE